MPEKETTDDTPEALKADIDTLYQMNVDLTNENERLRVALGRIRDGGPLVEFAAIAREALEDRP